MKKAAPSDHRYTAIDCRVDPLATIKYFKLLDNISRSDVSNVSTDSTNISKVNHPLFTTFGFDSCILSDGTNGASYNSIVDNCAFYYKHADLVAGKATCVACKLGYKGTYGNEPNKFLMRTCTLSTDAAVLN